MKPAAGIHFRCAILLATKNPIPAPVAINRSRPLPHILWHGAVTISLVLKLAYQSAGIGIRAAGGNILANFHQGVAMNAQVHCYAYGGNIAETFQQELPNDPFRSFPVGAQLLIATTRRFGGCVLAVR